MHKVHRVLTYVLAIRGLRCRCNAHAIRRCTFAARRAHAWPGRRDERRGGTLRPACFACIPSEREGEPGARRLDVVVVVGRCSGAGEEDEHAEHALIGGQRRTDRGGGGRRLPARPGPAAVVYVTRHPRAMPG